MDRRELAFFAGPKLLTCLTFGVVALWPDLIAGSAASAYSVAAGVAMAGLVTLFLLARGEYRNSVTVAGLLVQAALVIANFGAIFAASGLIDPARHEGQAHVFPATLCDGLYFATVTWTTLGYGDVQPPPPLRLLAAGEAVLGYIYLGLLVGVATKLYDRKG